MIQRLENQEFLIALARLLEEESTNGRITIHWKTCFNKEMPQQVENTEPTTAVREFRILLQSKACPVVVHPHGDDFSFSDNKPHTPNTPTYSVNSAVSGEKPTKLKRTDSLTHPTSIPKHTKRVLECIRSVLDHKSCYFVGQIIEARWLWGEELAWLPAEVMNVEVSADIQYYYVHFLDKPKKDDDWVSSDQVRPLSDLDSLSVFPDFFQLSQLSKQTTAGSSAYGSSAHHDPHEYSPKTIRGINFGGTPIRAWYRSPFPRSVWSLGETFLPMCSSCLQYGPNLDPHSCDNGGLTRVYTKGNVNIFQVDGAENPSYCERLFLLAKLFLEDKRTAADDSSQSSQVMSFLFYVLMENNRFVGYFSKYKMQKKDSPILSCILVLPSEQRKGFGSLLISVAYELAKREGRPPGSAERPLSGPGYFAFQSWWTWRMRCVLETCYDGEVLTIAQLGELAGMTSEDVVDSLRNCGALKHWGAGEVKLRESGKRAKIQLSMDMFRALEAKAPRDRVIANAFDAQLLNEFVRLCPVLQTPRH